MGLFHYTTVDVFKKIISTNRLRLSRVDRVRNNVEIDELRSVLQDCYRRYEANLVKFNLQNIVHECLAQRFNSYIFCFSLDKENGYLWKEYADGGCGVCIEFDENYFPQGSGRSFSNNGDYDDYVRQRMVYGKDEFISGFDWLLKQMESDMKSDSNAHIRFKIFLLILSDRYKSNDYKEEKEERLIFYKKDLRKIPTGDLGENDKPHRVFSIEENNPCLYYSVKSSANCYGCSEIVSAIRKVYVKCQNVEKEVNRIFNGETVLLK